MLAQRHARSLATLINAAEQGLYGHRQQWWIDRLDAELGNIRTALEWSLAPDGVLESGQFIAAGMRYYWGICGWSEGMTWLDRLLQHPLASQNPSAYARVLRSAGELAINATWNLDQAVTQVTAALDLFETLGEKERATHARANLGWAAVRQNKFASAAAILTQAHAEAIVLNHFWIQGRSLYDMAELAIMQQEYDAALQRYAEARLVLESIGDQVAVAGCYHKASFAATPKGDYRRAITFLAASLPLRKSLRDPIGMVYVRIHLGDNFYGLGESTQAAAWYDEAQAHAAEYGYDDAVRIVRWRQSYVLLQQGDHIQAQNQFRAVLHETYLANDTHSVYTCLDGLALLWSRHGEATRAVLLWSTLAILDTVPSMRWELAL